MSVSLWAVAKLGFHPGRMLLDFGTRIEVLIDAFGCQACSNTLWALAVLQVGAVRSVTLLGAALSSLRSQCMQCQQPLGTPVLLAGFLQCPGFGCNWGRRMVSVTDDVTVIQVGLSNTALPGEP